MSAGLAIRKRPVTIAAPARAWCRCSEQQNFRTPMHNAVAISSIRQSLSVLTLIACLTQSPAIADVDGADWPAYGRTFSEQRFSPLDQINRQTVPTLGLAWTLELPEVWNVSSAPVEVDGVIYLAVGFSVIYAVDAASGKVLLFFNDTATTE